MGEDNLMVEFQLPKLSARVRFPFLAPEALDKKILYLLCGAVLLVVSGCSTTELPSAGTTPTRTPVTTSTASTTTTSAPKKGIYHKVTKGQTIWRIAQAYNVGIDDIIKSNNIPNVAKVEENQLLFIPGADDIRSIPEDDSDGTKQEYIWPVKGKVTGFFGERKAGQLNKGIKIQGNPGDVVTAAREGRVVFADTLAGYGNTVIIDHEDGFFSVYAQNGSLMTSFDSRVDQGAPIGRVAKGTNIHFEIRKNTVAENPLYYLPQ